MENMWAQRILYISWYVIRSRRDNINYLGLATFRPGKGEKIVWRLT
jgi:hypothetical protein